MEDTHIALAHGNGGRFMRELIDEIFARHLGNPELDVQADAVPLALNGSEVMFTTDGFTVQPLEFPGGNIGSLAVHGTTNDLAVAGATPKYLSLNAFIEEGMEIATLERIIKTLASTAKAIGVEVVAGDTKVLRRGEGGGLYLATTGIGIRNPKKLGLNLIKDGDVILVSGPIGDHGISVMLAREEFGLHGEVKSDAVRDPVQSVCEMLGYDPMYLACEGRVVAVVSPDEAEQLLQRWRALPDGKEAAIIGSVNRSNKHVLLHTELGGERILEELEDDPLPRIC
jgi:hydrogenase expression/formation protein HypE